MQNIVNSVAQAIRADASIALCAGSFAKLLTRRSNGQFFRYLFCGEKACHKTIHYKTAIYLGVRSILGVGVSKLELLRRSTQFRLAKCSKILSIYSVMCAYKLEFIGIGKGTLTVFRAGCGTKNR